MGPLPDSGVEASETTITGWFHYNAHTVPIAEEVTAFGETATASGYNLIKLEDTSRYLEFLYVIPPLALFVSGILAAASARSTQRISSSVINGASVFFGYLIAVGAGVVIFSASMTDWGISGTMRPDIWMALIVSGIIYPLFFGGLGGLAYFFTQGKIRIQTH